MPDPGSKRHWLARSDWCSAAAKDQMPIRDAATKWHSTDVQASITSTSESRAEASLNALLELRTAGGSSPKNSTTAEGPAVGSCVPEEEAQADLARSSAAVAEG